MATKTQKILAKAVHKMEQGNDALWNDTHGGDIAKPDDMALVGTRKEPLTYPFDQGEVKKVFLDRLVTTESLERLAQHIQNKATTSDNATWAKLMVSLAGLDREEKREQESVHTVLSHLIKHAMESKSTYHQGVAEEMKAYVDGEVVDDA